MARFVILLRAINVGGRKLEMKALRAALVAEGYADCATYIQSGNIVLSADADQAGIEAAVESVIERDFGLKAIAIARTAADFRRIAAANPFPDAAPKMLHLCLTKHPPDPAAPELLAARARHGERIASGGGALWIDFAEGVGDSKLTPSMLDKATGSTLTARNLNTIGKLVEMAQA